MVSVFRPPEEHAEIVATLVLPAGAKVLWLHPPITSRETRALARTTGLAFVEGVDIADVARSLEHPAS